VTPYNPAMRGMASTHAMHPFSTSGLTAIDGMITQQATVIAFIDDFKLMMIMSLAVMPLVFLLKKARQAPKMDHSAVME
jgi:MFS transporter, DHA2 family, multidrug resistance protein